MSGASYSEATDANALAYNDSSSNPPRAILSGIDASGRAYLVIKAINVARNDTCTKWTHLLTSGATTAWTSTNPASENLNPTDRIIVISPGTPVTNSRALVAPTSFPSTLQFISANTYKSPDETRIIYGVDPLPLAATPLRMPFNRADYYVSTPADIPGRCAQGTGVLYKAIVSQSDGSFSTPNILPLLDCVADMQVITYLDTNGDGEVDDKRSALLETDARNIREWVKEVRVYILAHEGQRDTNYTNPTNSILVGESAALGRNFDLTTIPNWQNYRWKVYTLVVKPSNLR
jgi:hypothetical protein